MMRLSLFRFAFLFVFTAAGPLAAQPETDQNAPPATCVREELVTQWSLEKGCYKETAVWQGRAATAYFMRLSDAERAAHGGETSSQPAAALLLQDQDGQIRLIKAYCANYCWAQANADFLPQVETLTDEHLIIWAPENRLENRNGTSGALQVFDMERAALQIAGPEIKVSWQNIETPINDIQKSGECFTIELNTMEFVDTAGGTYRVKDTMTDVNWAKTSGGCRPAEMPN